MIIFSKSNTKVFMYIVNMIRGALECNLCSFTRLEFGCHLTEISHIDVAIHSWGVGEYNPVGPDGEEDPETKAAFFSARGQQIHKDVSTMRDPDT
jgi:hypothetical protein